VYASGSTAVVTGAAGGIGRAIASRLAAEGFRLVLSDLDPAVEGVATGLGAVAVVGDCASDAGATRLVEAAVAELDRVDIFFANAGTDVGRGLETPDAAWATALEVNVMAHVRAARLLVPRWLEGQGVEPRGDRTESGVPEVEPRGDRTESGVPEVEPRGDRTESGVPEGRFVVTASAAGLLTMLGSAPYSVSKHGAVAFAEWLRATYGHRGIVVQAICPQGVRTRMLDEAGPLKELLSRDRALEPEEVAEVVWQALQGDAFFVLPHPEVAGYYRARASEPDAWLAGMGRLQAKLDAGARP
jgi:NAD(P)-dependent dehydrogenase (short-subunit alcohol dehydrogenase family)